MFLERSYCPKCSHRLNWKDLIPVISFIMLRGKCRYCGNTISLQYPIVEISTGILFTAILWYSSSFLFPALISPTAGMAFFALATFFYYLIIASFLIVIFIYDLKHYIILDKIVYPAIGLVALYHIFEFMNTKWRINFTLLSVGDDSWVLLINPLISALAASAFFGAIVLISRGKWMGIGDVKLAFLMGLFLGSVGVIIALFAAFFLGAIVGIGLVLAKKKTMRSEVPFGPFLVTGTFIALFWGQTILDTYLRLLLYK